MTGFKQGHDPATGRFLPGNTTNPGGLSRRQRAITRMLEGLSPKAVRVLDALLDDPNPVVRLGAVKEVIQRIAPPMPKAPSVNVAIQNNTTAVAASPGMSREEVMARIFLKQQGLDPVAVLGKRGETGAVPAPEPIDVEVEEPEDDLDRAAAELPDDDE